MSFLPAVFGERAATSTAPTLDRLDYPVGPGGYRPPPRLLRRGDHGSSGGKGKGGMSKSALSAMTVMSFMFFLQMLEMSMEKLEEKMMTTTTMAPAAAAPAPSIMIMSRQQRDAPAPDDTYGLESLEEVLAEPPGEDNASGGDASNYSDWDDEEVAPYRDAHTTHDEDSALSEKMEAVHRDMRPSNDIQIGNGEILELSIHTNSEHEDLSMSNKINTAHSEHSILSKNMDAEHEVYLKPPNIAKVGGEDSTLSKKMNKEHEKHLMSPNDIDMKHGEASTLSKNAEHEKDLKPSNNIDIDHSEDPMLSKKMDENHEEDMDQANEDFELQLEASPVEQSAAILPCSGLLVCAARRAAGRAVADLLSGAMVWLSGDDENYARKLALAAESARESGGCSRHIQDCQHGGESTWLPLAASVIESFT